MLEGYAFNPAQTAFVQQLTSSYRNRTQLWNPIVWESKEPSLEEKMERDGDIRGALDLRCSLVAGRDWKVRPVRPRAENAALVALIASELLGSIQDFTESRKALARACFSGARFARIAYEPRTLNLGDGRRRTWLVPIGLEDADIRSYRATPDWKPDEDEVRSYWQRWSIPRGRWIDETLHDDLRTVRFVYGKRQSSLGYGTGLKDALAWWWMAKTEVFADSLAAVARFAQGMLMAKVRGARDAAGLPNREVIDRWQAVFEECRASNCLVFDAQDEVVHMDMAGTGAQLMADYRREIRSCIYTLTLGANLTVAADAGGSYALASVQQDSQAAVVQGDRDVLEEKLSRYLVRNVFAVNRPNLIEMGITEEDAPRLTLGEEQRREPEERLRVAQGASALGLPLSRSEVYEAIDFSPPEEGEEVIEPTPAPAAGPGLGALPFGSDRRRSA